MDKKYYKKDCILLLKNKYIELQSQGLTRYPQRSDFESQDIVAIKAILGLWPRACPLSACRFPRPFVWIVTAATSAICVRCTARTMMHEIAAEQQIVYLGSENDAVFELYFAPFGGELSNWDENYNPFAKQLRALQNSEDSIILIWNNVKFVEYSLRNQMEQIIIDAFHKNAHPDNKIYVNLPDFNQAAFKDLTVGKDIGYKSFNKFEYGDIHNKDMQLSYVQNGQRYYVSLLNSMNVHSG